MRERGIEDFDLVQIDPWPAGTLRDRPRGRPAHQPLHLVPARVDDDNGYARPIEGVIAFFDNGGNEVLEVVDLGVVPLPPERGSYLPDDVSRADAHRPEAARDRPARGAELHRRRQPRPLAALVVPGRLRPVRRAGPAHGRLPRRRPRPSRPAPRVDHRDGRALRPPGRDARLEERVRRRRVGPRPHGQLAEARLRLPRRHPLLRRRARDRGRASRTPSRTRSACTRRTTGSSGSTTTCTAAPTRCAARGGSSSASSRPSATTSTASTGTSTSTATSSSR